jgi:hypothetical protein
MRFIRQATTHNEQNLLITQEDNSLYFTTTKKYSPQAGVEGEWVELKSS